MQNANKAWWRDVKIYRSKDVPWRVKCRRMMEHVYSVFCFGSENWSWSRATLDRIDGWGDKGDEAGISIKTEDDETWANYCTRAARVARKIWTKMSPVISVRRDCRRHVESHGMGLW